MPKNFRITVDGRSYNVTVEDLDPGAPIPVAPQTAAASAAVAAPVAAPVATAAPPPPVPAGAGSIVAPLGGVVFSIDVPLGREVAVGDKVATVEAMKMKTEVKAKIAGKVATIAVKVNESVETGQLLMVLE
jgi:biotin carboxyl carrier protein